MAEARPRKNNEIKSLILRTIESFFEQNGYTPTIREIGERTGISSTSHISYHLKSLCRLGFIQKDPNISRGIRLVRRETSVRCIPIMGRIQAGQPIPVPTSDFSHYDPMSSVEIPERMLSKTLGNLFALEVKGDSMRDMLINEGDIVILRQAEQAQNGQIVAAWIKSSGETTLKSYYLENGRVRLQPANPEYDPIFAAQDDVQIQGQVVMLYRNYV
jgi:repressor LexA